MVNKMVEYSWAKDDRRISCYRLLEWLDVNPFLHRHVLRDLKRADSMMRLFSHPGFFDSEEGSEFKDSALIGQDERAQGVLDRRRHDSVKCLPKRTFEEWDKMDKKGYIRNFYPFEWDKTVRPIIAHCKF